VSDDGTTTGGTSAPGSGSAPADDGHGDDRSESGGTASGPPTYPAPNNPPGCPPRYSRAYAFVRCSPIGLSCTYPGAGDCMASGYCSTALMHCSPDPARDAGPDADPDASASEMGRWVLAQ